MTTDSRKRGPQGKTTKKGGMNPPVLTSTEVQRLENLETSTEIAGGNTKEGKFKGRAFKVTRKGREAFTVRSNTNPTYGKGRKIEKENRRVQISVAVRSIRGHKGGWEELLGKKKPRAWLEAPVGVPTQAAALFREGQPKSSFGRTRPGPVFFQCSGALRLAGTLTVQERTAGVKGWRGSPRLRSEGVRLFTWASDKR